MKRRVQDGKKMSMSKVVSVMLLSVYVGGSNLVRFEGNNCTVWVEIMPNRHIFGLILDYEMFENWIYQRMATLIVVNLKLYF